MELPAAKFPVICCRNPQYISPIPGHKLCQIATCKTNYIWTNVRSRQLSSHRKISVSANFPKAFDSENRMKNGWIHFIGVGGCGLSALAMLALRQGYEVSGSDIVWSSYMDALKEAGAHLYIGHSELSLQKCDFSSSPDAIVVSSAIPTDNVEILFAMSVGIPVYKRGTWLGKLTEDYNLIAVSGSHGKSTTASMLAYILKAMGDNLTAVVGAQVPQFGGGNVIHGNSHNFVLEADEYDSCFLELSPHVAVVTNVDWEHVDIFQDEEAVETVFRKFLGKIRNGGHLVLCGDRNGQTRGAYTLLCDSKQVLSISDHMKLLDAHLLNNNYRVTTYGMLNYNEWHASSVCFNPHGGCDYKLYHKGHYVADISLRIPGAHNVLNSLADDVVDKLALQVSIDPYRPLVILTLGAGDITNVGRKLLQKLKQTLP